MKAYYKAGSKVNTFLFHFQGSLPARLAATLIGAFCLFDIFLLRSDLYELYGKYGLVGSNIPDPYTSPYTPRLSSIVDFLVSFHVHDEVAFFLIITVYVASLLCIVIDYKCFYFAVAAWLIQLTILSSSFLFSHGGNSLTTFLLFVNVAICSKELFRNNEKYEVLHSSSIRLLQIQLCIIYFFAGFGKMLGLDWFDGNAMWLISNIYSPSLVSALLPLYTNFSFIPQVLGLFVMFVELLYPVLMFAEVKLARPLTLVSILLMHVFIAVVMGLYSFGAVMIILNCIAWGGHFYVPKVKLQRLKAFAA